ncbi:MAG: hypothetical protein DRN25_04915, partial [Thermoplasmata archaeon]
RMEGIANPPWVYGPKEVGEWINATYGDSRERDEYEKEIERKRVDIKLFWKKKEILNGWRKMFGYCEEDAKGIANIILTALYKAGFKRIVDVECRRRHFKCEKLKDLESILSGLEGNKLRFVIAKSEIEKASIVIRRFYLCKRASTLIRIDKSVKEDVARFLNIVKEKGLTVRDVRYKK